MYLSSWCFFSTRILLFLLFFEVWPACDFRAHHNTGTDALLPSCKDCEIYVEYECVVVNNRRTIVILPRLIINFLSV